MDTITVKDPLATQCHISQAIRTLRTNLLFCREAVRAIGLAGCGTGVGTSAIALQLAASIARTGKRVVLLDTDLHGSGLPKLLRLQASPAGLGQYLSGLAALEEVLRETDIPGMYILFAGECASNSADLLSSVAFRALMEDMKERFDCVLANSAPPEQGMDCIAIASALDGLVLVIDAAHDRGRQVRRIRVRLEKAGGRVLGAVLDRHSFREGNCSGRSQVASL